MSQRRSQIRLIMGLIALMVFLYVAQDFIGCANMLSGSSTWCEPIVARLGL
jgi:hypothetical protein